MRTSQRLASFALAFALAAPASALIDNSGSFAGSERLQVRGCGLHARTVSGDYVFSNGFYQGGAFTLNVGGSLYTGTYRVEAPHALRFSFDAASLAAFQAALEAGATSLCGDSTTLAELAAGGVLVLNKRGDRARLFLRARARTSDGKPALYRLRGAGPFGCPDDVVCIAS